VLGKKINTRTRISQMPLNLASTKEKTEKQK